MEKLKSLGSCKFLLLFHFIFVTKYRRKCLDPINDDLKKTFLQISEKYDFKIHVQEVDKDHAHLMIESVPKLSLSQICRVLKQESQYIMWKQHSTWLRKFYWNSTKHLLWSDGWFVSSIGNVNQQTLKHYIETQGS